jgi:hypothetical protein
VGRSTFATYTRPFYDCNNYLQYTGLHSAVTLLTTRAGNHEVIQFIYAEPAQNQPVGEGRVINLQYKRILQLIFRLTSYKYLLYL